MNRYSNNSGHNMLLHRKETKPLLARTPIAIINIHIFHIILSWHIINAENVQVNFSTKKKNIQICWNKVSRGQKYYEFVNHNCIMMSSLSVYLKYYEKCIENWYLFSFFIHMETLAISFYYCKGNQLNGIFGISMRYLKGSFVYLITY